MPYQKISSSDHRVSGYAKQTERSRFRKFYLHCDRQTYSVKKKASGQVAEKYFLQKRKLTAKSQDLTDAKSFVS